MNPDGQHMINENGKANGVDQHVTIHGKAGTAELQAALDRFRAPLLVIDVEGGEDMLLEPGAVPALASATILVEIHHWIREDFTRELLDRFSTTHHIRTVDSRLRTVADLPATPPWFLRTCRRRALQRLVEENRGPFMQWALMTPLRKG